MLPMATATPFRNRASIRAVQAGMSPSAIPLSILDLATIGRDKTARDAFEGSLALARLAERTGYRRVWYAEHHNMRSIASSATSVLIAHIAANTQTIRLG